MIIGDLDKLIVHFIGNKNNGEGTRFSKELTEVTKVEEYIRQLVNNSFKSEGRFQFHFLPRVELNPMHQMIRTMFNEPEDFKAQSQHIGRYLYDKSTHPQIKPGELCIAYFNNSQVNHQSVDAIGLFKSENKDVFLSINRSETGFSLEKEEGINTNKLDKGCLIFNTQEQDGYLIAIVDKTNRTEDAQYWIDDFLGVRMLNNEYHQTKQFMGLTKKFVTEYLTEEFEVEKADQIDLLNRSVHYFKNTENFDKKEFEEHVFADNDIIQSFQKFDKMYRHEHGIAELKQFDISKQAVKNQARVFKSVLKLDKNFHVYIHGNRDWIKRGVDDNGRKYYKIYFEEEN